MTNFVYWNENPDGEHTGDCVIRAITYATGYPYQKVEEKLYYCGKLLECDPFCVECYSFLLTKYFEFEPILGVNEPLWAFADKHTSGLYLVRSRGHISVLNEGDVYDIWDCRDMILTNAWKIA